MKSGLNLSKKFDPFQEIPVQSNKAVLDAMYKIVRLRQLYSLDKKERFEDGGYVDSPLFPDVPNHQKVFHYQVQKVLTKLLFLTISLCIETNVDYTGWLATQLCLQRDVFF